MSVHTMRYLEEGHYWNYLSIDTKLEMMRGHNVHQIRSKRGTSWDNPNIHNQNRGWGPAEIVENTRPRDDFRVSCAEVEAACGKLFSPLFKKLSALASLASEQTSYSKQVLQSPTTQRKKTCKNCKHITSMAKHGATKTIAQKIEQNHLSLYRHQICLHTTSLGLRTQFHRERKLVQVWHIPQLSMRIAL